MNFQSKSRVTPQEKDLANMAKPSRVSITLDIKLSGAQTRTSSVFSLLSWKIMSPILLIESKHLCKICSLETP